MPGDIGARRERIEIEEYVDTVDSEGQPIKQWFETSRMWAAVDYVSGSELEAMQKINAEITVRFTVNYRPTITEAARIVWRETNWNIHFIQFEADKFSMGLLAGVVQ